MRRLARLRPSERSCVESDPDRRDDVAVEAIEPGIVKIVAGAGLAGDVVTIERAGALPGAAPDDIRHHVGQQIGDLRADDLRRQILRRNQGLAIVRGLVQRRPARPASARLWIAGGIAGPAALRSRPRAGSACCSTLPAGIFDAVDVVGADLEAAVGEGRIGDGQLQRAQFGGAQRQGQIIRQLRFVEAEAGHVVPGVVADRWRASGEPKPDSASAPAPRAGASARRICRYPRGGARPSPLPCSSITTGASRTTLAGVISLVESRRIDEGLETRAGLAPGLGHAVELALEVIEAADQSHDRAILAGPPTPVRFAPRALARTAGIRRSVPTV